MVNFRIPRLDKDLQLKSLLKKYCRLNEGEIWIDPEKKHKVGCFDAVDSVQAKKEPYGYHITLGYMPLRNHQFLLRYDNLSPDGIISNSNFYIIGYNFWPTRVAEIQINYLVDAKQTNFENHWYLINFQISL